MAESAHHRTLVTNGKISQIGAVVKLTRCSNLLMAKGLKRLQTFKSWKNRLKKWILTPSFA